MQAMQTRRAGAMPSVCRTSRRAAPFTALASAAGAVQTAPAPLAVSPSSQLAQLAKMTVLSIDTGDLAVIRRFASTGLITDATTNPLFVSQVR